jgi:ribose transport system substrate-binding protein
MLRATGSLMFFCGLVWSAAGCDDGGTSGAANIQGAGQSDGKGGGKTYRIAVIPKGTTHDFWKSVHAGALDAAAEQPNVKIIWNGPDNEKDKEQQIKIVDTFINDRVDGICLAPIDRDALIEPVRRAKAAGIPVVIYDSGLSDAADIVSYVATDNYNGGVMAAQHLGKAMGGEGGVILLRYMEGSESTEQREQGFLETLARDFPRITVLSESQHVNSDATEALQKGESVLQDHKDKVAGVFTVCEPNNKGMLQALENLKLAGKVRFVAFDSDPLILRGLEAQKVDGVVLQNPVRMGYLAVKTMLDHLQGQPVEKRIPTGEKLATRDNMHDPEMKALLEPKQAH